MTCSRNSLLRVGALLAVLFGVAFFALPQFRTWLVAASPLLVALVCPLAMVLCMKGMHGGRDGVQAPAKIDAGPTGDPGPGTGQLRSDS